MSDHYRTLGVPKSASADEIKSAYRRLARDNHPDRNPGDARAEERFKLISEAYGVLGDPERRLEYDRRPAPGTMPPQPQPRRNPYGPKRGADLEVDARIPFEMSVSGGEARISVEGTATCGSCGGTGSSKRAKAIACKQCNGGGFVLQGSNQVARACSACSGIGLVLPDPCRDCGTTGSKPVQRAMTVKIPAGVRDGSRVRLVGKGRVGVRGGPDGDLYVVLKVEESPLFKRSGDDLEVEVRVSVTDAILGASVEVPTLTGTATLKIPPGTPSGTIKRIKGAGSLGSPSENGRDLLYRITVLIPTNLTDEQRQAVEALATLLGDGSSDRDAGARPSTASL